MTLPLANAVATLISRLSRIIFIPERRLQTQTPAAPTAGEP